MVVAEAEALPFKPASFDLILSVLDLHHVNDLPGALLQLRQALKPDGLLLASLFAGETLTELRRAWMEAELAEQGGAGSRVSPFADPRDLAGLLQRAGFARADRRQRYDRSFLRHRVQTDARSARDGRGQRDVGPRRAISPGAELWCGPSKPTTQRPARMAA